MLVLTRLVTTIYDRPWPFFILWITLFLGSALCIGRAIKIDVSMEQLQKPSSNIYQSFAKATRIFGRDESLILLVNTDTLLSAATLQRLNKLHHDVFTSVPHVTNVNSIINTPLIQKKTNTVIVSTAFDPWPETEQKLSQRFALIHSAAQGTEAVRALISNDQKSTLIIIKLQEQISNAEGESGPITPAHYQASLAALTALVQEYQADGFDIQVTGQAALLAIVHQVLLRDIYLLPAAALGVSILTLLILFRRKTGIMVPGLVIVLPITMTLALMALTQTPVQIPTGLLPPALVVVAVAFCVHILTAFYSRFRIFGDKGDKRGALIFAFEHKAGSLTMSMITTIMALLSFGFASIAPVANIGIFGGFGILIAYFSVVLVIPIYVRWAPLLPLDNKEGHTGGIFAKPMSAFLLYCTQCAIRSPKAITLSAVFLILLSLLLASQIQFSHKPTEWLPKAWPAYQASHEVNKKFSSAISIEILFDTHENNGVYDAEFITMLNNIQDKLEGIPSDTLRTGLTVSISSQLQQIQAILGRRGIPADGSISELAARELANRQLERDFGVLRLIAPQILSQFVDQQGRYTRLIIRVPTLDGADYLPGLAEIEKRLNSEMIAPYTYSIAGQAALIAGTYEALSDSATISYILSLILITAMMIFHMSSWRDGLLLMLPNLLPITMVVAAMQLTSTPLDFLNILVVTLSMGLVVDDTIHFGGHFRQHFKQTHNAAFSAHLALQDTGRAMIVTTLVLALGWQMLFISQFDQLGLFGILTSSVMMLGLLADLIVAPALMVWRYQSRQV